MTILRKCTTPPTTVRAEWGLACPSCGSDEHIEIELACWALLSPDGTDTDAASEGNHYWDEHSACRCEACSATGTVESFQVTDEGVASPSS